jgi:alpha-mannosidase
VTPLRFFAGDIDIFHLGSAEQLEGEVEISAQGPLRASATLRYKYGNSSIQSIISLDAMPTDQDKLSMLRFENHVDWHSQHVLLKFQLPLAIKADAATYDTQFGVISRPTHRNTSWDAAKFEVCAHKFADLSEFGYGVALINNNK